MAGRLGLALRLLPLLGQVCGQGDGELPADRPQHVVFIQVQASGPDRYLQLAAGQLGAAAADFRVHHAAHGHAGLQQLPDILTAGSPLAVLAELQLGGLADHRGGGAVEVRDEPHVLPPPHGHAGARHQLQREHIGVLRAALAAYPAVHAEQAVGRLALTVLVKAASLNDLGEGKLLLQKAQTAAPLPVQDGGGDQALYHQLAADELAVRAADVDPGGQDLLRAAPARGQGQLLREGELLLPHAGGYPGLPPLLEQLHPLPLLHGRTHGQGHVAAADGAEEQVGPGQHLPGVEDAGVDAPELPPDVQKFALRAPLSLPVALEGDLEVEGAGTLLLLWYVQHRHLHRAAGAETPVRRQLPVGQTHQARGVHDPGDVRAAVRHNVLPHGLAGEGGKAERLIVVMAGFFELQFHGLASSLGMVFKRLVVSSL